MMSKQPEQDIVPYLMFTPWFFGGCVGYLNANPTSATISAAVAYDGCQVKVEQVQLLAHCFMLLVDVG